MAACHLTLCHLPLAASPSPLAGVKIIFRVGLVLLKHTLGSSDKLKSCQGQYETMERLRALSPKIMQETFLVQEVRVWGGGAAHGAAPRRAELAWNQDRTWFWGYPCPGWHFGGWGGYRWHKPVPCRSSSCR